jgi:hypothetical protein
MRHVPNFGIRKIIKHGLKRLLNEHYSINVYITLVITHEPPHLTEEWAELHIRQGFLRVFGWTYPKLLTRNVIINMHKDKG